MSLYHSYDPAAGHGLPHDPLKAVIAPRPIAWISTLNEAGQSNLAPYSYFNLFSHKPPVVIFGSEGEKHSLKNLRISGEFVVNLVSARQVEAMNLTSAAFGAEVDEFAAAGLGKLASDLVAPPRVAGAPAALECKVIEIKPLSDLAGEALDARIVIGQVVRVHLDDGCLTDGLFDMSKARMVARCGYRGDYVEAQGGFELLRPKVSV